MSLPFVTQRGFQKDNAARRDCRKQMCFFLCWENTTNNNVSFFLLDVSSVRFPPSFAAPNALREIYVDFSSFFSCDVSLRRQQFRLLISSLFFCPAFHGSPWRIPGWEHFSQGTRATPYNRRQVHQVMKDGAEGNTGFFSRAFALFRVYWGGRGWPVGETTRVKAKTPFFSKPGRVASELSESSLRRL